MSDPAEIPQPPATPAPVETITGAEIAADLLGTTAAAPVTETAAALAVVPSTVPAKVWPPDSLKREFDPRRFRTMPDGSPFLNARGHFMPRGGRKPGRAPATAPEPAPRRSFLPPLPEAPKPAEPAATGTPGPVPPVPAAPIISRSAIEQTAEAYLRTGYLAADKLMDGKGEWKPDDPGEHASIKEPLVEYLAISGAQPLPPWARLAVAVGNYVLRRFDRPNTKATAGYYWRKFTAAKPAQPAAEPRPAQPRSEFSPLTIEPLR